MKLELPPNIVISKMKHTILTTNIKEESFKASRGWHGKSRKCWGLKSVILHDEGADVDKENSELLTALKKLYQLIGGCGQTGFLIWMKLAYFFDFY